MRRSTRAATSSSLASGSVSVTFAGFVSGFMSTISTPWSAAVITSGLASKPGSGV